MAHEFEAALTGDLPLLVDFWAEWCGPCRWVSPLVEELAEEYKRKLRVAKVNVDEAKELASKYQILSIPTLMIFRNGQVLGTHVGAVPKDEMRKFIEKTLGSN